MKVVSKALLLLLLITLIAPSAALAYSYGDPGKEDVAESFKEVVVKLNANPIDWKGAYEIYKVRRPEISSHFGESAAVTLDMSFEAKDRDLTIDNFKAVLVMNLKRRFDYALKDINEYSKAKLLLAKAKGTFDVLQPYIKSDTKSLAAAFDAALRALGNPGLFGVGEKPVNPQEFEKQAGYIYQTVKPLFPFKELNKEEAPQQQAPEKQTSDGTKPAETAKTAEQKPPSAASVDRPAAQPPSKGEGPTDPSKSSGGTAETTQQPSAADNNVDSASTAEPANRSAGEPSVQPTSSSQSKVLSEAAPAASPSEKSAVSSQTTHAPMERSSKTNPMVSILIIAVVMLLGTGGFWFARKKRLF